MSERSAMSWERLRRRVALFAFGSTGLGGPSIEARGVLLALLARLARPEIPWPSQAVLARELGGSVAWLRARLAELEPVVLFGPGRQSGSAPVAPVVAVELLSAWMAGTWEWPAFVVRKVTDYSVENRTTNGALSGENRTTTSRAGVNPPPPLLHERSPLPPPSALEGDPFERDVDAAISEIRNVAGVKMPKGTHRSLRASMAQGITLTDVSELAESAAIKGIVSFSWFLARFGELLRAREQESGVVRLGDYVGGREPEPWEPRAGGGL